MDYSKTVTNIRAHLKEYIEKYNLRCLVLGVSGGIDSAVCAALAQPVCNELNIPLIGRSITIESNKEDEIERAKKIGELCQNFKEVDLTSVWKEKIKTYEAIEGVIYDKIAGGNLKARTRMEYLYGIAGIRKGLVLSTDNYTEFLLGFWTLHGDVGDLAMIQNFWKEEVYQMAEFLCEEENVVGLQECIEAIPTDGLGISNSDLDQIYPNWDEHFQTCRLAYEAVDQILKDWSVTDIDEFLYDDFLKYDGRIQDYTEFEKYRTTYLTGHPVVQRYEGTHGKRLSPYNFPRHLVA